MEIGPTLYAAFMIFARVTAMLHVLPLFSMKSVPVPVRAGLGALVALLICPYVETVDAPGWEVAAFAIALTSELFLGAEASLRRPDNKLPHHHCAEELKTY